MEIGHGQRALWMVLSVTLAGPFFAGLVGALLALVNDSVASFLPVFDGASTGAAAVSAFTWAIIPAVVAGVGLVPYVLQGGTFGWLHAAVAGVVGFAAGMFVSPFASSGLAPVLAFVAGLIMLFMRHLLIGRRILLP